MKAKLVITMLFVMVLLAACEALGGEKKDTTTTYDYDLSVKVCYDINETTNIVSVMGVIENVGTKTFDKGGFYNIDGVGNSIIKSSLDIALPESPWTLMPGEKFKTIIQTFNYIKSTGTQPSTYCCFVSRVFGNEDQNQNNNVHEIFANGVSDKTLWDERNNYICPSSFE